MVTEAFASELVTKFGPATGLIIFLTFVFTMFFLKTFSVIIKMLETVIRTSGKTLMSKEQTTVVFRAMLDKHIQRKVLFLKNKLITNHIQKRQVEIKKQIRSEFETITQQEAQFLSTFNTPAGDIGEVLLTVMQDEKRWTAFLEEIYVIFFGDSTIDQKLDDAQAVMVGIVNHLVQEIESRM